MELNAAGWTALFALGVVVGAGALVDGRRAGVLSGGLAGAVVVWLGAMAADRTRDLSSYTNYSVADAARATVALEAHGIRVAATGTWPGVEPDDAPRDYVTVRNWDRRRAQRALSSRRLS